MPHDTRELGLTGRHRAAAALASPCGPQPDDSDPLPIAFAWDLMAVPYRDGGAAVAVDGCELRVPQNVWSMQPPSHRGEFDGCVPPCLLAEHADRT